MKEEISVRKGRDGREEVMMKGGERMSGNEEGWEREGEMKEEGGEAGV